MKNISDLSEKDLQRILSNPFYCLEKISEQFIVEREPIISEEEWIEYCIADIKKSNSETFLRNLLKNLKTESPNFDIIVANPIYCLRNICPIFADQHEALVSEDEWVRAGAVSIKEHGFKVFLYNLLENMKGNYVG